MIRMDGSDSKLFMSFEKVLPSAQGMGIWEDRAYILFDTGKCAVYDLKKRNPSSVAVFPLGSYNEGIPSKDYLNHANSCMFGTIHHNGNPIPLLYVNTGSGTGFDKDGFFYRCAVENITETILDDGTLTVAAQTLQTISLVPEGKLKTGYLPPCWGCPAWLVDTRRKELYILSAEYRTTRGHVPEGKCNRYILTVFPLPELSAGSFVKLTFDDIVSQFSVPSELQFTQGGTIFDRKAYFTYGCPRLGYPLAIAVFDLDTQTLCALVDNLDQAFAGEEIECCAEYQGKLLCNTCDGSIFVVGEGRMPL